MLRTSSYTVYCDLPGERAEMLLVHGYTGAYDKVSRRVVNYLRSREARRAPKPLYGEWSPEPELAGEADPPPPEVIELLKRRGYLTALDVAAEEELFVRLATKLHERSSRRMPSYVFMPTYDCNLRCSYCFQDHMRTDQGFRHLLHTMRPEMIDRIFRAMPELEAHHGVEPASGECRHIGFFGGEPLLAENRPAVAYIIEKARALGKAEFWAVTNGTELEAYRDLIGPSAIAGLQITLDGPPDEHDVRRIHADGSGTFDAIAANVTAALDLGAKVSIRLNVDRRNIGDLPRLAEAMIARGWHERRGFSAYTAPVNAVNDKTERAATMSSWELDQALTAMYEEYPGLAIIGRPDEGIRIRARQVFEGGEEIVPHFRPSFCGAHDQMYIFDPFGDVYACWERTGDPEIRIARVTPEGNVEFRFEINREWRSRSVASNPVCRRCRYALHCGGGCAVLALGQRGKIHANFCDGFASRFRASVAEAYRAFVNRDDFLHGFEKLCDL